MPFVNPQEDPLDYGGSQKKQGDSQGLGAGLANGDMGGTRQVLDPQRNRAKRETEEDPGKPRIRLGGDVIYHNL